MALANICRNMLRCCRKKSSFQKDYREWHRLLEQIEEERRILHKIVEQSGDLGNPLVYKQSTKIDRLLIRE